MFIEQSDKYRVGDNAALKTVVDALPVKTILKPYEICDKLHVCENVIYNWIQAGNFSVINLTSGPKDKPRWGIIRESFIEFLKTRVIQ